MPDQNYLAAGQNQWEKLQEKLAHAHATFASARNCGDMDVMGTAVQDIAECNEKMNSLRQLHDQVVAQEQAQALYQETPEEWQAKDFTKCTWNDTWKMITQNKSPAEAEAMKAGFNRGIAEVNSRRARGE